MDSVALPVVHPSFRNLQRNGRLLHIIAAALFLTHALAHFREPSPNPIYLACLFLIALDILILVFVVNNVLLALPRVNLLFRFIEFIFFLGIGIELPGRGQWLMGAIHIALSLSYLYLFYCENKLQKEEFVSIHHTGISIPDLPESKFLKWTSISGVQADYHSITIELAGNKQYHFVLQRKMEFGELDQIHEFCRHYLGNWQNC